MFTLRRSGESGEDVVRTKYAFSQLKTGREDKLEVRKGAKCFHGSDNEVKTK